MDTQEIAPRRRGRPPKPVPVTPSWINEVDVALRISGLDPVKASITDVTQALTRTAARRVSPGRSASCCRSCRWSAT